MSAPYITSPSVPFLLLLPRKFSLNPKDYDFEPKPSNPFLARVSEVFERFAKVHPIACASLPPLPPFPRQCITSDVLSHTLLTCCILIPLQKCRRGLDLHSIEHLCMARKLPDLW